MRAEGPDGYFEIEQPTSWEEVEAAVKETIKLHQNRWNELGFPGVFYEDRFAKFFRQLVYEAYRNNWLWLKVARDKEGVCAARMLIKYNGRYFDYISGFDDNRESAKRRPGIGLLLNVVNDAIEEGVSRIELLRGEESYKYDFTDRNFNNWQIRVELNQPQTFLEQTQRKVLNASAVLYRYGKSESRLMNVQRKTNGWLRMLPEYVRFRKESIKMKMNET
jgi:CelD/BcsL family acetyltransferase involved in cellulose biosynthesis